ncbi:GNAT family N-acetyltransferase [Halomarina rubra]|uniref:GNAT family N-acetyltransferase n=1 Tax=Halomarina rubra TaxID=2071873 RepID=A0ABD6AUZ9_9EURY|nr:GNAT family N-acetyltransferase [Halomarina rubra]
MDATYTVVDRLPTAATLARLRELNDMGPRSIQGLRRGLPNSVFGVVAVTDAETVVGTGRIVGDDASIYQLCDLVVHPDHQGRGLGTRLMDALMAYVEETAPPNAYVNLFADVEGYYERWGFEHTAPASRGMFLRTDD